MFDQLFEDFHKASESTLQMQQEIFRHWAQKWLTAPSSVEASADLGRTFQKRWLEFVIESLNKQREGIDAAYKSGIQVIGQAFRASEAKSPEDYRRIVEDLWRQLLENFKAQSETQLRDFQNSLEKSFETAQKAAESAPPAARNAPRDTIGASRPARGRSRTAAAHEDAAPSARSKRKVV